MNQEPEMIDIFAMLAMVALIIRNREGEDIVRSSYEIAEQMIEERDRYVD